MTPETPRPCPTCGRPERSDSPPFCSRRCADVDLQRWLSGAYVIPGDDEDALRPGEAGQGAEPTL